MLEYIDKKLPFAIPTPLPTDLLPSDDGTREPASQGMSLHGAMPTNTSVELSVHARIAQGAFLLSYVVDRVSASDPNSSSCGAARLDNTLRSYAMTLLQPKGHGHLCWPYSICLRWVSIYFPLISPTWLKCNSALLTLNLFEVSVEPRPPEAHEKQLFQSRAALGLQSVLRMITEATWGSSNFSDAEIMTVPIWAFHRAYSAALVSLELGIIDEDEERWTAYIQAVKRMLKIVEPRCRLAGIILFSLPKISV